MWCREHVSQAMLQGHRRSVAGGGGGGEGEWQGGKEAKEGVIIKRGAIPALEDSVSRENGLDVRPRSPALRRHVLLGPAGAAGSGVAALSCGAEGGGRLLESYSSAAAAAACWGSGSSARGERGDEGIA